MHTCGTGVLLGEQILELFAIFEVHRHVEVPGNIRLPDIKLLEEGRKEFSGVEIMS